MTYRQQWYDEVYLKSEWWQGLRRQAKARFGNRCQICHATDREMHLHHFPWGYRHLEKETLDNDLLWCCKPCHKEQHEEHPDMSPPPCQLCGFAADTEFEADFFCWDCMPTARAAAESAAIEEQLWCDQTEEEKFAVEESYFERMPKLGRHR